MKNRKTLRIAEMPPPPLEMKDNKTFGITEKPPSPQLPPPPSPLPPPPPLGIQDKRTLGIAEKPPPRLAMKENKKLGIAEKPLPPPPLGFLGLVKSRLNVSFENRSEMIEIISIWTDIDGSFDGSRWISTRSQWIWWDLDGSKSRKRSSWMESSFEEPAAKLFFLSFFSLSECFFYLSECFASAFKGPIGTPLYPQHVSLSVSNI